MSPIGHFSCKAALESATCAASVVDSSRQASAMPHARVTLRVSNCGAARPPTVSAAMGCRGPSSGEPDWEAWGACR
jgi:hypothetical protein